MIREFKPPPIQPHKDSHSNNLVEIYRPILPSPSQTPRTLFRLTILNLCISVVTIISKEGYGSRTFWLSNFPISKSKHVRGRPHHDQHTRTLTPSIFLYPQIKFFSSQVFPFVLTNSRLQISFKDFSLFCSSLQFSEALCQNFYFLTKIPSFMVRDTLKLRKNNILSPDLPGLSLNGF